MKNAPRRSPALSLAALPAAFALSLAAAPAGAEEPELTVSPEELPRIDPVEPAEALATFEVAPGFDLLLSAAEPDVMDPVAMTFDEQGRAWVLEMRSYPERREMALCRIRVLEDENGDGVFDSSRIFKDGLKWVTGILCYKGGVLVGATPDITYLRDTTGDGVADEERVLFTGFGEGRPELNMQALFNSLRWGPDNRVWGATAGNGGTVTRPGDPSFEPVELRRADFSFDPEELDLRAENGTAQYGLAFDSLGRRFVCSNSRHIVWVAYERSHVSPNPWYSPPPALVDIPADGAAAPVYRISPDEPWRIVRTRWRVAGVVRGAVEGGGRVSGYFTSATGVHPYWGDAFGEDYRDNIFVADVGSNLVHRKLVKPDGAGLVAVRPDPEEQTEFLRSTDIWFRPTWFATGPDGCLYITDMYREVIEHPWSLPDPIKVHLDLYSGSDRGRIYRVAPDGFAGRPAEDLGGLDDEALEALLDHPNDWHRTTARRLLYERGRPAPPKPPVSPFPAALAAEEPLLDRLGEAVEDRWMRAAVLNSLRSPGALAEAWKRAAGTEGPLLAELAGMVGRSGDEGAIRLAADSLATGEVSAALAEQLAALQRGMGVSRADWRGLAADGRWDGLVARATALLEDGDAAPASRVDAVGLLARFPGPETEARLKEALLSEGISDALQRALVAAVGDLEFLVDRFAELPGPARDELGNRILGSEEASARFLEALRAGDVELAGAPASLVEGLRQHREESVAALAAEVLPPVDSRENVIARYEEALALPGDRERGKAAFAKACVACHRSHEGEGIELGPPIATYSAAGGESLLGHILDPNREVAPQYQAFSFEFEDSPPIIGIILTEDATEVTVRMPGGIDQTFPRSQVTAMQGLGQSLMPEGLEAVLTVQEMADLLAYIAAPEE